MRETVGEYAPPSPPMHTTPRNAKEELEKGISHASMHETIGADRMRVERILAT